MPLLATTTLLLTGQIVAAVPRLSQRSLSCPTANSTTFPASNGQVFQIECGIDRWGGDMPAPNGQNAASIDACIGQCAARPGCISIQWVNQTVCYLKDTINAPSNNSTVWGAVIITNPAATTTTTSSSVTPTSTVVVTFTASSLDTSATSYAAPELAYSPVAPTSSNAPVAPVSAASGSCVQAKSLSSKRGLAYNDGSFTTQFGSKITWAYNWDSTPFSGFNTKLDFAPMLWGAAHVSTWNANAKAAIGTGSDTLLSFNEPDMPSQANLDPATAASLFKQYMQPFACKARLSSPAVTSAGTPQGLTWLKNFLSQCSGCTIDVVAVHWYGLPTEGDAFKSFVQQAYSAGGNKPLWITEFGFTGGNADQQAAFFDAILPWLDSTAYVERYAFFQDAPGSLINSGGSGLSPLGQLYSSI